MAKLNPVKWSTQKIKELLIQIDQTGVIPRYNPFYNNDAQLFAGDINFGFTEEEFIEKSRVVEDIFYFATTHVMIKTDEGEVQKVSHLRDYQKNILHHLDAYRWNIILASRQIGKCVHPFTTITVEINNKVQDLPIFELFYQTKIKMGFFDKIIYSLLKTSHRFSA